MKLLSSLVALTGLLLLAGCGGAAAVGSSSPPTIDCAVEIQLAVVSGLKPGHKMNDGEWHVAGTCVLPVQSAGGPGRVVSSTNGVVMELQWQNVRRTHNGTRLEFEGGRWWIRNRIDRRDGVSQQLGGGTSRPDLSFGADYEWLASCEIDTTRPERTGRSLVIRGRVLSHPPSPAPLPLEARAGLGS